MSTHNIPFLENWVPLKIIRKKDGILCKWLNVQNKKFSEPFFDETAAKCLTLRITPAEFNSVSSLEIFPQWSKTLEAIYPSAIIFHISRCGSTLLSQLLSLTEQSIVLSEVPFIDELLRLRYSDNEYGATEIAVFLTATLKFYGQKRNEQEKYLFIKTDSWHIFFWKELRKLYPYTPFIMLYRTPEQVIYSQERKRGMHAVPGLLEPEIFGFDKSDTATSDFNGYTAKVIEKYLGEFLKVHKSDSFSHLMNYNEGILAILEKINKITGLKLSEIEKKNTKERISFHGKYPQQEFSEENKFQETPSWMNKCFSLYQELEAKRMSQNNTF